MTLKPRNAASHRPARGFTLVELAIVLVIVGLIIGGVLTAQQITQNARITSAIQGLKAVQAAVQTYNQNYGALPGDDGDAASRFAGKGVPENSGGNTRNGIIGAAALQATFNVNNPSPVGGAEESQLFWTHLRAAGLTKGDPASTKLMSNPFNGIYGVQNGAFSDNGFAVGTNVVCIDQVPGNAATAIDLQLDDGSPKSGTIRGGANITGAMANPIYESNSNYVLCTPL